MSASSQSQGKTIEKSPGLLIHCHGGGFVAQSSASHEVSGDMLCCTVHMYIVLYTCIILGIAGRRSIEHVSVIRYDNM